MSKNGESVESSLFLQPSLQLERGFEPRAFRLLSGCSTTELYEHACVKGRATLNTSLFSRGKMISLVKNISDNRYFCIHNLGQKKVSLKGTGIEPATFGTGIRRATIAPTLH
jgi:hypothetical protein